MSGPDIRVCKVPSRDKQNMRSSSSGGSAESNMRPIEGTAGGRVPTAKVDAHDSKSLNEFSSQDA